MTHFAIVAPPLKGHLDPFAALGRALAGRGHQVTVFVEDWAVPLVGAGLAVEPLRLPLERESYDRALTRASGPLGLHATIRNMARRTEALCEALPAAFRRTGVDIVLADQTEAAGALAALACGLPHATVGCGLPLNREEGVPPPFVGWDMGKGDRALWLNRGGYRVVDWLMRPISQVVRERAGCLGLGWSRLEDSFSARLQILQMPRGLDHARRELPPTAHHVGPLRDPEIGSWEPGIDPSHGVRPLAYCSLGTLQGGRSAMFRAFADAAAGAGYRPVIVHCGRLRPAEAVSLPGGALVADFLPQRAAMAKASLAIVHGGLNTALDALEAALPMVITPIAFEQHGVARRIAASGAGLVVSRHRLGQDLRAALRRLADEPSFAWRARALSGEIRRSGGAARACELLEALAAGRTVETETGVGTAKPEATLSRG